ncbi:hypothetical protein AAMO2058_000876000 [Amorphochlora amoebiformis]
MSDPLSCYNKPSLNDTNVHERAYFFEIAYLVSDLRPPNKHPPNLELSINDKSYIPNPNFTRPNHNLFPNGNYDSSNLTLPSNHCPNLPIPNPHTNCIEPV